MKYTCLFFTSLTLFANNTFAQWEKVAWENAWVRAMVAEGSNVYCATGVDGAYYSSDGGSIWNRASEGIEPDHYALYGEDLIATQNDLIYLGGDQLFRRSKTGTSWSKLAAPIEGTWINSILGIGGDTIIASVGSLVSDSSQTQSEVFLSTNGGITWEKRSEGLPPALFDIVMSSHGSTLCISALRYDTTNFVDFFAAGTYYSTNLGLTWSQAVSGLNDSLMFDLLATDGSSFFGEAYMYDGLTFTFQGIYRSTDNGVSWQLSTVGIDPAEEYAISLTRFENQMIVSMSANNYITTDHGATWQQLLADYSYQTYYDALRVNGTILLATYGGVYIPNDELATATDISWSGDGLLAWYRIGVYAEDDHIYASLAYETTSEFVARSTDNGIEWRYRELDPTMTMSAAPWVVSNNTVFTGGRNEENGRAAILSAASPGDDWFIQSSLPRNGYVTVLDVKGDSILAGMIGDNATAYLYFSTNQGTTWKLLPTAGFSGEAFGIVKIIGKNLFATDEYWHAFLSTNGGTSWQNIDFDVSGMFFTTGVVAAESSILAVGNNIDYTAETIVPQIHISTDGGRTWDLSSTGIPNNVVFDDVTADPLQPHILYASTDPERWVYSNSPSVSSVFISENNGKSWSKFANDLPQASRLFVGSEYVFAQSEHGLYRAPKIFSSVDDEHATHEVQPLINTYPNPTYGSATVSFTLHESGHVQIAIYDILGKEITTIASAYYPEGEHTIPWDFSHLPTGTCTVHIVTSHGEASTLLVKAQ